MKLNIKIWSRNSGLLVLLDPPIMTLLQRHRSVLRLFRLFFVASLPLSFEERWVRKGRSIEYSTLHPSISFASFLIFMISEMTRMKDNLNCWVPNYDFERRELNDEVSKDDRVPSFDVQFVQFGKKSFEILVDWFGLALKKTYKSPFHHPKTVFCF